MKLKLIKATDQNSTTQVSDDLFVKEVNQELISQAVLVYLSNKRQGTSQTQTRSDVHRTSRKVYKQKGTGNARHGDKTANIFVGGAAAHGPRGDSNWTKILSLRMKQESLKHALTAQAKNIVVTDEILKSIGKTKEAAQFLHKIGFDGQKVLLVLPETLDLVVRSFRNIANLQITRSQRLNAWEIAMADKIIFTNEAITLLQKRLAKKPAKAMTPKVVAKAEPAAKPAAVKPAAVKPAAAKPAVKPAVKTAKKPVAKATVKAPAAPAKATVAKATPAPKPAAKTVKKAAPTKDKVKTKPAAKTVKKVSKK